MTIRAALLDKNGVFQRMDELPGRAQLTSRHLPSITECDLPAGEYVWHPDVKNEFGGAFVSLLMLQAQARIARALVLSEQDKRRYDALKLEAVESRRAERSKRRR